LRRHLGIRIYVCRSIIYKSTISKQTKITTPPIQNQLMPFSSTFFLLLLLVCVLHTVRAAFTSPTCDTFQNVCVQKNSAGSWCLASTIVVRSTDCAPPYSVPLAAHLKQDLSIAYYSPTGQRLGGANYPVPQSAILYVCLSAQLGPAQYYTMCAQARRDNSWEALGCQVDLAPSHISDGCYGKVSFGSPTPATWLM